MGANRPKRGAGKPRRESNTLVMGLRHWAGDLSALHRELRELSSRRSEEEERASYELAVSARRFSRRAKHVVDDKLSFSATLMRAGEVDAANRLLEEVEQDVRVEEAALIETMNEAKVARASSGGYALSRKRLARMVGVSLAGAMLMGFSALGMAAASFLQDREEAQARQNAVAQRRALRHGDADASRHHLKDIDGRVRKLLAASGMDLDLSPAQILSLERLTSGSVNVAALESFLSRVLPSSNLASHMASQIAARVSPVVAAVDEAREGAAQAVEGLAYKAKRRAQQAEEQAEESAEESESTSEKPAEEAEETAKEEGKKSRADGNEDNRRSGGGGGGNGDGLPQDLPLDDTP